MNWNEGVGGKDTGAHFCVARTHTPTPPEQYLKKIQEEKRNMHFLRAKGGGGQCAIRIVCVMKQSYVLPIFP